MTVLTHNLNLAENFQELAGRSTYFYVTREASPEVEEEVAPCDFEEFDTPVDTDVMPFNP